MSSAVSAYYKSKENYLHIIKPFWATELFGLAAFEKILFDENTLSILQKNRTLRIPIESIESYDIIEGLLYNKFRIKLKDKTLHTIDGFPNSSIDNFTKKFDNYYASTYYKFYYEQALKIQKLRASATEYWKKQAFYSVCSRASELFKEYRVLKSAPTTEYAAQISVALDLAKAQESIRLAHNNNFINSQMIEYAKYFNTVESNPLTQKQKEAVISHEKNTLIIAGAGSGKTSVMVAKAGYIIQKYGASADEILLLAFNKKASLELQERIYEKLNLEIDSMTFHALGLSIIAKVDGTKPLLGKWAKDERNMAELLEGIINKLIKEDKLFANQYIGYFEKYFYPYRSKFEFKSHGDYIEYIKAHELRSLNGDLVKSYEELEIANFLFMNKIPYIYEASYEHNTATAEYRQYQPDFYLPTYGIYIEHFGINELGETAPYVNRTL